MGLPAEEGEEERDSFEDTLKSDPLDDGGEKREPQVLTTNSPL